MCFTLISQEMWDLRSQFEKVKMKNCELEVYNGKRKITLDELEIANLNLKNIRRKENDNSDHSARIPSSRSKALKSGN